MPSFIKAQRKFIKIAKPHRVFGNCHTCIHIPSTTVVRSYGVFSSTVSHGSNAFIRRQVQESKENLQFSLDCWNFLEILDRFE